jgi:hypothetical protein
LEAQTTADVSADLHLAGVLQHELETFAAHEGRQEHRFDLQPEHEADRQVPLEIDAERERNCVGEELVDVPQRVRHRRRLVGVLLVRFAAHQRKAAARGETDPEAASRPQHAARAEHRIADHRRVELTQRNADRQPRGEEHVTGERDVADRSERE